MKIVGNDKKTLNRGEIPPFKLLHNSKRQKMAVDEMLKRRKQA